MSLRKRLTLSIFLILTLISTNVVTYFWGSHIRGERVHALSQAVANQLALDSIRQQLEKENKALRVFEVLLTSGEEELTADEQVHHLGLIDQLEQSIHWAAIAASRQTNAKRPWQENSAKLFELWRALIRTGSYLKDSTSQDMLIAYRSTLADVHYFESVQSQYAESQVKQIDKTVKVTDSITVSVFLLSIFLTSGLGFVLVRYANRSLTQLNEGAQQIGDGNLQFRIPVMSDDELGELAISFNAMAAKLDHALEEAKQLQHSADQANRAKSTFLANMSHELRTPMNTIIGYAELIQEEMEDLDFTDQDDEQQQVEEDIEKILRAAHHLLTLINDVLDLSKIEAGKVVIHRERFDAKTVIADAIASVTPQANERQNTVIPELPEHPVEIDADTTKFGQTLLNLLSNACKFTHKGEIRVALIEFKRREQAWIKVEVRDTGIGMTEEQCEQVFDAFVQADISTTKEYGGTGLGLAISRQFCRLMGGDLRVSSQVNKGSHFWFELPIADYGQ